METLCPQLVLDQFLITRQLLQRLDLHFVLDIAGQQLQPLNLYLANYSGLRLAQLKPKKSYLAVELLHLNL